MNEWDIDFVYDSNSTGYTEAYEFVESFRGTWIWTRMFNVDWLPGFLRWSIEKATYESQLNVDCLVDEIGIRNVASILQCLDSVGDDHPIWMNPIHGPSREVPYA